MLQLFSHLHYAFTVSLCGLTQAHLCALTPTRSFYSFPQDLLFLDFKEKLPPYTKNTFIKLIPKR